MRKESIKKEVWLNSLVGFFFTFEIQTQSVHRAVYCLLSVTPSGIYYFKQCREVLAFCDL